jgi:hypothetical protein
MASSGTDGADDKKAQPAPASVRPDDLDRGWSLAPKAEVPKEEATQADPPKPETPAEPPVPAATSEASAPAEVAPPVEASPPVERSASTEASPPAEARVEASPPAEAPAEVSPPAEPSPSVQAPPAVETLPPEALWPVAPPLAKPPPLPVTAPSASNATESFGQPGPLASLLETPPTKGWFFVGGVGMIVALFLGIVIGRGLPRPAERVAAAPVPPARSVTPPVAPAPVPAPRPAETASAQPASPRPGGMVTKQAPGPFNAQAAKLAIDRIVPRLKGCKQPGEPPGTATVTVTFAPTGRVSNAAVTTQRYAGTRTGTCIAARLREARVSEFTGKPVTVKRGVAVR